MVIAVICAILLSFSAMEAFSVYSAIPYTALAAFLICALVFRRFLDKRNLGWMLLWLGYSVFSLGAADGGLGSLAIQIYIMTVILAISNIRVTGAGLGALYFSALAVWAVWMIKSPGYFAYFSESLDAGKDVINSNTAAETLLIACSICLALQDFAKIRVLRRKAAGVCMAGLTILGIIHCRSRTTLAAMAVFVVYCFIIPQTFWTKKRILTVTGALIAFGTVFPLLYLALQNHESFNRLVYEYTGRYAYTGREQIWADYYRSFGDSARLWLLGMGSHAADRYLTTRWGTNVHNSYLAVQMNFGMIGLFLFSGMLLTFLGNALSEERDYDISSYKLRCIFAFWGCLMIGYSEVTLIWSLMIPLNYLTLAMALNRNIWRIRQDRTCVNQVRYE